MAARRNKKPIAIGERVMAYAEGREARARGLERSAPWIFESSEMLREIWLLGWDEAQTTKEV